MLSSFHASPLVARLQFTPTQTAIKSIRWKSAFKAEANDRVVPTPRNLSQDLNCGSPWLRSLDVNMSDRYFPVKYSGSTPVRSGGFSQASVPQLIFPSPGTDVQMMSNANSIHASPLFSPPRQRRRLN